MADIRIRRNCNQCGREMLVWPSWLGRSKGKFCSKFCERTWYETNTERIFRKAKYYKALVYNTNRRAEIMANIQGTFTSEQWSDLCDMFNSRWVNKILDEPVTNIDVIEADFLLR